MADLVPTSSYRLFETRQFLKDLETLDPPVKARVERKLKEYVYPLLRQTPYAGPNIKRLQDWDPPTWRYRIGPLRVFYEIEGSQRIISFVAVEWRSQAY